MAKYAGDLAGSYENMAKLNLYNDELKEQISALSEDVSGIIRANRELAAAVQSAEQTGCAAEKARAMVDLVRPRMDAAMTPKPMWTAPAGPCPPIPISCIVYNPGEIYLTV